MHYSLCGSLIFSFGVAIYFLMNFTQMAPMIRKTPETIIMLN